MEACNLCHKALPCVLHRPFHSSLFSTAYHYNGERKNWGEYDVYRGDWGALSLPYQIQRVAASSMYVYDLAKQIENARDFKQ